MRLEQLLQPHDAVIVLVDNGESLPAPMPHYIHVSLRASESINNTVSDVGRVPPLCLPWKAY